MFLEVIGLKKYFILEYFLLDYIKEQVAESIFVTQF